MRIRPARERVGQGPPNNVSSTARAAGGVVMVASMALGLWAVDALHRDALWLATLFAAANVFAVLYSTVVLAVRWPVR